MKQLKNHLFLFILFLSSYKTIGASECEAPTSADCSKSFECLIVDDSALNRRLLGKIIERAPKTFGEILVHYAENEEQAVSTLAEKPSIQLVISDGQMTPGIGGKSLVTEVRTTFKGFIVAWSTDPTEQDGMVEAGANYALTKPARTADIECMLAAFYESLSTRPSS